PCVSIFGPGMGIKWAPMAGGILVERNELNCKPCIIQYLAEISDVCKTGTRECLEGITPEEVFDACQELLKTSRLRH
ncbi:MAG: glycosyltransferase family 9 protein, partial [Candidatus Bathyanammoxibius sp.]